MGSVGCRERRSVGSEKLGAYIRRQGIRLEDFAAKVGTDKALVSRWVRGVRRPGTEFVVKIERATGIPPSAWLRPAPVPGSHPTQR